MTALTATQTANQATTKGFTWFTKSSLIAVALMATMGSTLGVTEASAAGGKLKCNGKHAHTKACVKKANKKRGGGNTHQNDDLGKGLAIVGGLLIGGAILHEIFDDNGHQGQVVHHQPVPKPNYDNGHGNRINKKRRKRLINKCSSAAVNDALANGYSSAWISNVQSVKRKGDRRFKVKATLTQQFQQRAPRRHSGYRNTRHWNNGSVSWGYQSQPRYVTYEEQRTVTCIIKRGEVRKLRKW